MSDEENSIDVNVLVAIGPVRLATLLAETAKANPSMRRRLQFELSAQKKRKRARGCSPVDQRATRTNVVPGRRPS